VCRSPSDRSEHGHFQPVDTVMLRSMPVVEPAKLVEFMTYRPPYGRERFRIRCSTSSARRAGRSRGFSVHSSVNRTEIGFWL